MAPNGTNPTPKMSARTKGRSDIWAKKKSYMVCHGIPPSKPLGSRWYSTKVVSWTGLLPRRVKRKEVFCQTKVQHITYDKDDSPGSLFGQRRANSYLREDDIWSQGFCTLFKLTWRQQCLGFVVCLTYTDTDNSKQEDLIRLKGVNVQQANVPMHRQEVPACDHQLIVIKNGVWAKLQS